MIELSIITIVCVTTVVIAEQIRRYYTRRREFEYKIQRLQYDDLILADGGENEVEER